MLSRPILGQQVTLTNSNRTAAAPRVDLLVERGRVDAPIPECDLVVSGVVAGVSRSWTMDRSGMFQSDRAAEPALDRNALEALLTEPADVLTFLCAPWGSGTRIGLDRDLDGAFDGDE